MLVSSIFMQASSTLADLGTEQLEFIGLSQRTGNPKFKQRVGIKGSSHSFNYGFILHLCSNTLDTIVFRVIMECIQKMVPYYVDNLTIH
jgi:hypothetical protein